MTTRINTPVYLKERRRDLWRPRVPKYTDHTIRSIDINIMMKDSDQYRTILIGLIIMRVIMRHTYTQNDINCLFGSPRPSPSEDCPVQRYVVPRQWSIV